MMTSADYTFHNIYLLQEIFGHAGIGRSYCDIYDGDVVAEEGFLKLLQLKAAHENDLRFTRGAMDWSARVGDLHIVKWLHENRSEGCSDNAMNWAAMNGHLETVQWLHANREEGCTTFAMDHAAKKGYLETVQWLHENRSEGCTTNAMDWAAEYGHLHVVQWLYANRSEQSSRQPVEGRHASEAGSWQGDLANAVDIATRNGHKTIIRWINYIRALQMGWAVSSGHPHVVNWLRENPK